MRIPSLVPAVLSLALLYPTALAQKPQPVPPPEGSSTRGGGDEDGIGFRATLRAAFAELKNLSPMFPELDFVELERKLDHLHVVVVEAPLAVEKDGLEQDSAAVNTPDQELIEVRRQRWLGIQDLRIKQAVALHELFSLVKLEKTGEYLYSSRFLEKFGYGQCQQDLCQSPKTAKAVSGSEETSFEALLKELGWKTISPMTYKGREFYAGHIDVLAWRNGDYTNGPYVDTLPKEQVLYGDNICKFLSSGQNYAASTIVVRDYKAKSAGLSAEIPMSLLFAERNPLPGRTDLVLVSKQIKPDYYCAVSSNIGCFSMRASPVAVFETLTCKK